MFRGNWFIIYLDIQKELVLFSPEYQAEVGTGLLYRYWCLDIMDIQQELVYIVTSTLNKLMSSTEETGLFYTWISKRVYSLLDIQKGLFYNWISRRDWFLIYLDNQKGLLSTWISCRNWFLLYLDIQKGVPGVCSWRHSWYGGGTFTMWAPMAVSHEWLPGIIEEG